MRHRWFRIFNWRGRQRWGIFVEDWSPYAELHSTLIALNFKGNLEKSASDLAGVFHSRGNNLVGGGDDHTGLTNGINNDLVGSVNDPIDPLLRPLADNGGPTPTHALLPGSPAIDAGDDTLTGTDQRGRPRRSGARVDIGAFEFQAPTPQALTAVRPLANGAFQFSVSNVSDVPFSVLATTNVSLPVEQWIDLGPPVPMADGLFQFTDPAAGNQRQRFFQLRWQ